VSERILWFYLCFGLVFIWMSGFLIGFGVAR
jgi:hypothetical protein